MLRHDAEGYGHEGNSSGTMPKVTDTRENELARCRWLFERGEQLRQDADDFLGEGKCSGADIFYVFYEIAQNQNIFNIFTLLVRILCTFSLYNDVECSL